jgi:hypothetical protein
VIGALGIGASGFMAARRDINFASDDGLNAARRSFVIEIGSGEQISMVGDGNGGHSAARGFVDEFADIAGPIQQREIGMQMEMYKVRLSHAGIYSKPLRKSSLIVARVGNRNEDALNTINAALWTFLARFS